MRNRRVLLGIVVAILLAAISLGRAGAQGYGSADGCANAVCTFKPGVTLTMAAGDLKTIVIDLDGFAPLSDVTVTLRSDPVVLGTFKSDAQGRVRATVTLPSNVTIGNHSLAVAGLDPAGRAYAVTSPLVVAAPATTTTATTSPSGKREREHHLRWLLGPYRSSHRQRRHRRRRAAWWWCGRDDHRPPTPTGQLTKRAHP